MGRLGGRCDAASVPEVLLRHFCLPRSLGQNADRGANGSSTLAAQIKARGIKLPLRQRLSSADFLRFLHILIVDIFNGDARVRGAARRMRRVCGGGLSGRGLGGEVADDVGGALE